MSEDPAWAALQAAAEKTKSLSFAPVPLGIAPSIGDIGQPEQPTLQPPRASNLGGSTEDANTPLKLILGTTSGTVRVVWGTIDNIPATGMSPGDDPPFEIAVSGNGFVYAVCSIDLEAPESVTSFTITTGASVPANTTSVIYKTIGSYNTVDGVLTVAHALSGSLNVHLCGSATTEIPIATWS